MSQARLYAHDLVDEMRADYQIAAVTINLPSSQEVTFAPSATGCGYRQATQCPQEVSRDNTALEDMLGRLGPA
jgi:hypothetical protein